MTAHTGRTSPRRLIPRALAALSACCLTVLTAGPASASASSSVINAGLNDVSCTAANNCMAVGAFLGSIQGTSAFQEFTLAEIWNGSTWTILPTPSPRLPGGGAELNSIACSVSTSCMAVGETLVFHEPGGYLIPHPFAESWNGSKWSVVAMPALAHSGASLNGVSCTAASSCMAVGSEGTPKNPTLFTLAESWNGTAWKFLTTPAPLTPGGTALSSVSCTGPACMAVGYYGYNNGTGTKVTLAESWNGAAWQRRDTPTPGASGGLAGVSCATASACKGVGGHAVPTGNLGNATLAEQWGARNWRVQPTPNPAGAGGAGFDAVSCTSPSRCMATGAALDQTGESQFTLAEAWNGTNWSLLRTPSPGSFGDELLGASCTSASSCMAVGDFTGIGNEMTLAEAWDGTAWSVVKTPHP